MQQVSDNWKGGVTVNPTHLCQDLLGSKELKETRGSAGEGNIFERSVSSNTPGLGLDKKSGTCKRLGEKHQEEKDREGGLFEVVSSPFQSQRR